MKQLIFILRMRTGSMLGATPSQESHRGDLRFRRGSLLIEVLLGIVLFGMFASASFLTLLTGQESSRTGSARIRGVYYTEQALEVAKAIRDLSWSELSGGRNGFTLTESGTWILTGSSLNRYSYNTYIIVDDVSADEKAIHARSAWKQGKFRSGATVLSLLLTNWRTDNGIGDWSDINRIASVTFPATINFNDMIAYKNYVYLTSERSANGHGLYIIDVSNPASPSRVSSAFRLPGTGHKPVAYRDRLYVMVEDGSNPEIKAYNIAAPTSLNGSTSPIATYNIPGGNDRGLSLAVKGNFLFAGADANGSQSEFYVFNISTGSLITLVDELNITGNHSVNDIFIRGDYALLATDSDTAELTVIDISDPSNVVEHAAYNATSVEDGLGARLAGTGFYVARSTGASDEYVLITGSGGWPSTDPAKSFGANIGGGVNAMDMDPLGCYAFLATSNTSKELQIRSARYKTVDEEAYEDHTTGNGRGIYYDVTTDNLYLATESGFYVYEPGASSDCR